MSMMSTCPNCGHTCHMWAHLSHAVTLLIGGPTCHMWSHLSPIVTLGHIRSHLSPIVTLSHVTILSKEINISTADQKVHSLSDDDDMTNVAAGKNGSGKERKFIRCEILLTPLT